MKTTIPYKIAKDNQIAYGKSLPIFEAIPTEGDFEIATMCLDKKVALLDFGILKLVVARPVDKYYLSHEKSFTEGVSSHFVDEFDTYDNLVDFIISTIKKEKAVIDSFSTYLSRVVSS